MRVTNSQVAIHENRPVRCSLRAPRVSQSNINNSNNFLSLAEDLLRSFPQIVLQHGNPCFLILLIYTIRKITRWNLGLTPRLHCLDGELIQWVDKAKNVWITVGQLPTKAGWYDAPFALQGFSRSIASTPSLNKQQIRSSISTIISL